MLQVNARVGILPATDFKQFYHAISPFQFKNDIMKKMIVLFSIGCMVTLAACSQSIKESQVPANVKMTFQKEFPNVAAKWEKEKENYEVNFKKVGKTMSAVITKAGVLMETETDIAVSALPAAAHDYLKMHFKGVKVKEAAKITNEKGEITFEAEVSGKDVIFDSNGNFLKVSKP